MIYLVEGVDAMEILPLDDIALMKALIFVTLLNHGTTHMFPSMNTSDRSDKYLFGSTCTMAGKNLANKRKIPSC